MEHYASNFASLSTGRADGSGVNLGAIRHDLDSILRLVDQKRGLKKILRKDSGCPRKKAQARQKMLENRAHLQDAIAETKKNLYLAVVFLEPNYEGAAADSSVRDLLALLARIVSKRNGFDERDKANPVYKMLTPSGVGHGQSDALAALSEILGGNVPAPSSTDDSENHQAAEAKQHSGARNLESFSALEEATTTDLVPESVSRDNRLTSEGHSELTSTSGGYIYGGAKENHEKIVDKFVKQVESEFKKLDGRDKKAYRDVLFRIVDEQIAPLTKEQQEGVIPIIKEKIVEMASKYNLDEEVTEVAVEEDIDGKNTVYLSQKKKSKTLKPKKKTAQEETYEEGKSRGYSGWGKEQGTERGDGTTEDTPFNVFYPNEVTSKPRTHAYTQPHKGYNPRVARRPPPGGFIPTHGHAKNTYGRYKEQVQAAPGIVLPSSPIAGAQNPQQLVWVQTPQGQMVQVPAQQLDGREGQIMPIVIPGVPGAPGGQAVSMVQPMAVEKDSKGQLVPIQHAPVFEPAAIAQGAQAAAGPGAGKARIVSTPAVPAPVTLVGAPTVAVAAPVPGQPNPAGVAEALRAWPAPQGYPPALPGVYVPTAAAGAPGAYVPVAAAGAPGAYVPTAAGAPGPVYRTTDYSHAPFYRATSTVGQLLEQEKDVIKRIRGLKDRFETTLATPGPDALAQRLAIPSKAYIPLYDVRQVGDRNVSLFHREKVSAEIYEMFKILLELACTLMKLYQANYAEAGSVEQYDANSKQAVQLQRVLESFVSLEKYILGLKLNYGETQEETQRIEQIISLSGDQFIMVQDDGGYSIISGPALVASINAPNPVKYIEVKKAITKNLAIIKYYCETPGKVQFSDALSLCSNEYLLQRDRVCDDAFLRQLQNINLEVELGKCDNQLQKNREALIRYYGIAPNNKDFGKHEPRIHVKSIAPVRD